MSEHSLHNLLDHAAGNHAARELAYAELLRLLTMFVRAGMGPRLRSRRESLDVCQSIARSFVEDHQHGAVRFESEAALVAYLKTVVNTKLALLARHDGAHKRGGGAVALPFADDRHTGPAGRPAPAEALLAREALDSVESRMAPDDLEIARLRLQGMDWNQIAQRLGRDPAALRQRWSRLSRSLADDHS